MKALQPIRRISKRMFYRVFLTYSLIIFLTMTVLFVFLTDYYSDFIVQREVDRQETIINEIKSELQGKHQFVRQGIQQLYQEQPLIEDLAFALQHDYQDYIGYRLDKFSNSDSFVPYNFDIFVKNYFSRDPESIALRIRNESLGTEYMYLFDHSRWKQGNHYKEGASPITDEPSEPKDMFVVEEQINDPVSMDRLGKAMVYFGYDSIDGLLTLTDMPAKSAFIITNEEGDILYSYGKVSKSLTDSLSYSAVQKKVDDNGRYYIQSAIEPVSGHMVTAIVPEKEIAQLFTYKTTIFFLLILLTTIAIILPYFALRGYSKRLDEIMNKMKEVQEGNIDARIETTHVDDDLTDISHTINKTLDDLNDYIDKVYRSKLKQTEAELANLQAQINPHFLYNTLEAIRMKSLSEGGRTSAKMIVQLAHLFRYSLKSADLVPVEDEINHAHQYIELFKVRFPDQLTTELYVEEELKSLYLPPFILQPFIENFLIHGFRRDRQDNHLSVSIHKMGDTARIIIEDNGTGIEQDRLHSIMERLKEEVGSTSSIGVGNVHRRIRLKYGEGYGVEIKSIAGVKTTVQITLPFMKEVQ